MTKRRYGGKALLEAIDDGYRGRFCKQFYCGTVKDYRCCVDCRQAKERKCALACLNHPDRCQLEDVARRPKEENNVLG